MKKIISLLSISILLVACDTADETTENVLENQQSEVKEEVVEDTNEEKNESEKVNTQSVEAEEDKEKRQAQFVQEAFDTFLNYTNENYEERITQSEDYYTIDTLNSMIGSTHLDTEMTFEQTSDNEEIYKSLQNDTQFIYKAEISFQVEENPKTIITNFYNFDLIEDNNSGAYKIDNVEVTVQQPPL